MQNISVQEKLASYLETLGYSKAEISEVVSAYISIIPVLANISLRIYREQEK